METCNKKEEIEETFEIDGKAVYVKSNLGNFYLIKKSYYFYFDILFNIFGIHQNSKMASVNSLEFCTNIEFNKSIKEIKEEKSIRTNKKTNTFRIILKKGKDIEFSSSINHRKYIDLNNHKTIAFNHLYYHKMYIDLNDNEIIHKIYNYDYNETYNKLDDPPNIEDPNQWKPMEANYRSEKEITYKISDIENMHFYFDKNIELEINSQKEAIEIRREEEEEEEEELKD